MLDELAGLLFLDVDGVLNRTGLTGPNLPGVTHRGLERECVEGVARFVKRFRLGVVISSSWRTEYSIAELQAFLRLHGGDAIANRMVGITVKLVEVHARGKEVEATRQLFARFNRPYVIFDDSGKHGFPAEHFVQIAPARGFCQEDFARGAAILARQGVVA